LSAQLAHDWAGGDKECTVSNRFDIIAADIALRAGRRCTEIAPDYEFELLLFQGLNQYRVGAEPDGFLVALGIVCVEDQNDRKIWTHSAQPSQHM
jgi:hypothetical protein